MKFRSNHFKYFVSRAVFSISALTLYPLSVGNTNCELDVSNNTELRSYPVFRLDEIKTHKTKDSGVWVTYKDGMII